MCANVPQKVLGTRQVIDAVILFAVQLGDVQPQLVAPVIQAIPLQAAMQGLVLSVYGVTRRIRVEAIRCRILLRHVVRPHVIVVREIENRAIHIEHQGLATAKCGFGIDFHCFILRARSAYREENELRRLDRTDCRSGH